MLLDLLDHLEWYLKLHPLLQRVIDILDRSLPYEMGIGIYQQDGLEYEIQKYVTSTSGQLCEPKGTELHVVLEGEELVSLQRQGEPVVVSPLTTGMFLLLQKHEHYRHQQTLGEGLAVKKVIFRLSEPVS